MAKPPLLCLTKFSWDPVFLHSSSTWMAVGTTFKSTVYVFLSPLAAITSKLTGFVKSMYCPSGMLDSTIALLGAFTDILIFVRSVLMLPSISRLIMLLASGATVKSDFVPSGNIIVMPLMSLPVVGTNVSASWHENMSSRPRTDTVILSIVFIVMLD